MCLFIAARAIVKGSLVSAMYCRPVHFYEFPAFCLQQSTTTYGSSSDNNSAYASYTIKC